MARAHTIDQEVLQTWREAERLLDQLPPVDPDHETILLAIHSLRTTYQAITTGNAMRTPEIVADSREIMSNARALITLVRLKQIARR